MPNYILIPLIILAVILVFALFITISVVRGKRLARRFKNGLKKVDERFRNCGKDCECPSIPWNIDARRTSCNEDFHTANDNVIRMCDRFSDKFIGKKICLDCDRLQCQQDFADKIADKDLGFAYSGFKYDAFGNIFFAAKDAFQRRFGYSRLYDRLAPWIGLVIDSEPVQFRHDNKWWKIELWKGQYGMTTGAEVGFYVRDHRRRRGLYQSVKDCDMIDMEFVLRRNNRPIMQRQGRSWWLTGFVLGVHSRLRELDM
ncbi:MAG: DUF4474 domain-containing protein, partial [Firmicutes bacterium]|nr:DUF4474 domain-containing protein [Bacillota bacterium]